MVQRYNDGAKLPYRILYNRLGTVTRTQEARFGVEKLAEEEMQRLINRGHSVDYSEWDHVSQQYVTKDRFN